MAEERFIGRAFQEPGNDLGKMTLVEPVESNAGHIIDEEPTVTVVITLVILPGAVGVVGRVECINGAQTAPIEEGSFENDIETALPLVSFQKIGLKKIGEKNIGSLAAIVQPIP